MLTAQDSEMILRQCLLQSATSPEEVAAFTAAYETARIFSASQALKHLNQERILDLTGIYAVLTVPATEGKYRTVPVVFANGDRALHYSLIPNAMDNWAEIFICGATSLELYREFEKIHPFVDGNGRVGHLLWATAVVRETGDWPLELPPDLFGRPVNERQIYKSSFGDVETC